MKQGFSALEFIVSMLIGTILMTQVFVMYDYISKSIRIVQRFTTTDTQIIILKDRLQKDFTGLSLLWFTKADIQKSDTMKKNQNQPEQKSEEKNKAEDVSASGKETSTNFYSKNNETGSLLFFTFVTTNAMQMYDSVNKRFVRVVYALQQRATDSAVFKLVRKEIADVSADFDEKELLEEQKFYEIASNIKVLSIEYGFIDHGKNDGKEKSEKAPDIKWVKDWGIVKEKTDTKEYRPSIPEYIKMSIIFEKNIETEESKKYELYFHIPIDPISKFISFSQKRAKQQSINKGPNTPGNQPTPSPQPGPQSGQGATGVAHG